MNHGSLFSGIGGFDLPSEWMGWNNVFQCEKDPFCRKVLKYYWPKAILYDDIKQTDFSFWKGRIDILTGGFPCQPFSLAGKRKGTEDDRNLWPEMLRAIQEIAPEWVVGENVYGIINWNGGLAFEQVQADLEAEGYEVQPYILPACGVNAPHKRDRVWFVAYRSIDRGPVSVQQRGQNKTKDINTCRKDESRIAANTQKQGLERSDTKGQTCSGGFNSQPNWQGFPTQSPVCSGNDGLSSRLDGITFPRWRNESIKAYGNAIVPQVAYEIFRVIDSGYKQNI